MLPEVEYTLQTHIDIGKYSVLYICGYAPSSVMVAGVPDIASFNKSRLSSFVLFGYMVSLVCSERGVIWDVSLSGEWRSRRLSSSWVEAVAEPREGGQPSPETLAARVLRRYADSAEYSCHLYSPSAQPSSVLYATQAFNSKSSFHQPVLGDNFIAGSSRLQSIFLLNQFPGW
ncbi:hypothetical protein QCA50_012654 [Cerrena zonata]|uniref:Ig-like domain-containing protein n=1 Tax=Cerrena zonata TaxID=2478898 RepID=A0AAW0FSN1_9APHY